MSALSDRKFLKDWQSSRGRMARINGGRKGDWPVRIYALMGVVVMILIYNNVTLRDDVAARDAVIRECVR